MSNPQNYKQTMMQPDAEKWLGIGGADDKEYFGLKDLNVFTPHDYRKIKKIAKTRFLKPLEGQEN